MPNEPQPASRPRAASQRRVLRAGMIGLDTSHVPAFTQIINDPNATGHLAEVQIVAAHPGASPDVPAIANRRREFTERLREMGVEIVSSEAALIDQVDVVLLENVDGRPRLAQARAVIQAGKPLFVDKPLAGSLADGLEILRLANEAGVPCFASSALRFSACFQQARRGELVGSVTGCEAFGPCLTATHSSTGGPRGASPDELAIAQSISRHHPDLYWYGVHGIETLFTVMGPGCESVTRVSTPSVDYVTGTWLDGRVGSYRGIRNGKPNFGAVVYGSQGQALADKFEGYRPLAIEICKFFGAGQSPVDERETIEVYAFMEAADESQRQGGKPVTLERIVEKARQSSRLAPQVELSAPRPSPPS